MIRCKEFVVVDRDGVAKMGTECYSCIPIESQLKSMANAGYTFRYDNKKISLKQAIELSHYIENLYRRTPKVIKIKCIETGELFDKQSEAAKRLNIDPAAVSDSLKTGRKRAGYTFERIEVVE